MISTENLEGSFSEGEGFWRDTQIWQGAHTGFWGFLCLSSFPPGESLTPNQMCLHTHRTTLRAVLDFSLLARHLARRIIQTPKQVLLI